MLITGGYLKKQKADILAFKRDENLIIPNKINYDGPFRIVK